MFRYPRQQARKFNCAKQPAEVVMMKVLYGFVDPCCHGHRGRFFSEFDPLKEERNPSFEKKEVQLNAKRKEH